MLEVKLTELFLEESSRIKKRKDLVKKPMGREIMYYKKVEYYPIITSRNDDAPNFSMRLFKIGPGGYTSKHKHSFEHEVYVINGEGYIILDDKKIKIEKGNAFIIYPYETHQLLSEKGDLEFICVVPNKLKNQPE